MKCSGCKNKEFWEKLKEWDVIILMETWVDEKGWRRVKETLSRAFRWEMQKATRKSKKERTIGGMVMGITNELIVKEKRIEGDKEGIVLGYVRLGRELWKIMGVYVNRDIERILEEIEENMGGRRRELEV